MTIFDDLESLLSSGCTLTRTDIHDALSQRGHHVEQIDLALKMWVCVKKVAQTGEEFHRIKKPPLKGQTADIMKQLEIEGTVSALESILSTSEDVRAVLDRDQVTIFDIVTDRYRMPRADEEKICEKAMETLEDGMREDEKRFKEATGRNMTYAEMRSIWG